MSLSKNIPKSKEHQHKEEFTLMKIQPKPNGILHPDPFYIQIQKDSKQRVGERFTNQMESKNK